MVSVIISVKNGAKIRKFWQSLLFSPTNFLVRTVFTAVGVVGGDEGLRRVENFFEQLLEPLFEFVLILADVADRLAADDERRVVCLACGVLDENECRGDGGWILGENGGVEQGLEVVVGVLFGDIDGVENLLDGVNVFHGFAAGFVVDDADLVVDAVEAVDDAFDVDFLAAHGEWLQDFLFHVDDGERCELAVDVEEPFQIVDDDLPIDELQTVESGRLRVGCWVLGVRC